MKRHLASRGREGGRRRLSLLTSSSSSWLESGYAIQYDGLKRILGVHIADLRKGNSHLHIGRMTEPDRPSKTVREPIVFRCPVRVGYATLTNRSADWQDRLQGFR